MGCKNILTAVFFLISAIFVALVVRFADIPWGNESCHPQDAGCPDKWFSVSYLEARQKFRVAAKAAGLAHTAVPVHTDPASGQEFTIDFAVLHGSDPRKVMLHFSGTHGVEGFAGSAIQHKVIVENLKGKKSGDLVPTIIFVHAVNPSGMGLNRRFNHNNVDLNRNCLNAEQWKAALARSPNVGRYEDFKELLNPNYPPTAYNMVGHIMSIPFLIAYHGFVTLKRALVSGQYHDPTGVYYGGIKQEKNYDVIQDFLKPFNEKVKTAILVDVHSGLGPSGQDTLLVENEKGFQTAVAIVGPKKKVECSKCGTGGDAISGYELQAGGASAKVLMPNAKDSVDITEEFGTIPGVLVATSVIFENAANNHARNSPVHERAGRWTRNAFYVPLVQWKRDVIKNGVEMFDLTLTHLDKK